MIRAGATANADWLTLSTDTVDVRIEVAANPHVPPSISSAMALVESEVPVKVVLACTTSASAETLSCRPRWLRIPPHRHTVLQQLAAERGGSVRWRVASNPSADHALLAMLAADEPAAVRAAVARNVAVPAAILETLVRDPSSACRSRRLAELAHDADGVIRAEVAVSIDPKNAFASRSRNELTTPTHSRKRAPRIE